MTIEKDWIFDSYKKLFIERLQFSIDGLRRTSREKDRYPYSSPLNILLPSNCPSWKSLAPETVAIVNAAARSLAGENTLAARGSS